MKLSAGRKVLLVTLFGVVVYAAIALTSDIRALGRQMGTYHWWTFAAALGLALGNYALRFLKWEYYLRRLRIGARPEGEPFEPIPPLESLTIYLAGWSMSLTPGKAGEVFRSALLHSARGTNIAKSAPIVVADRISDLLALIVLVAVGTSSFPGYGWIALAASAMVGVLLLFVFSAPLTHWTIDLLSRFGPLGKIAPKLREAYTALRVVMSPPALLAATAVSVVAWALECVSLSLILRGLGSPVSLSLAFFVYGISTIAGAIAMLPGGLGGTEVTMRTMLGRLGGLASAPAAAATLLTRIATLWFAVLIGFGALAVFRAKYDRKIGG